MKAGTLWGMLFFSSTQVKKWNKDVIALVQTISLIITNLLSRQYQEKHQVLQTDYLERNKKKLDHSSAILATAPFEQAIKDIQIEHRLFQMVTNTIPDAIFLVDVELSFKIKNRSEKSHK